METVGHLNISHKRRFVRLKAVLGAELSRLFHVHASARTSTQRENAAKADVAVPGNASSPAVSGTVKDAIPINTAVPENASSPAVAGAIKDDVPINTAVPGNASSTNVDGAVKDAAAPDAAETPAKPKTGTAAHRFGMLEIVRTLCGYIGAAVACTAAAMYIGSAVSGTVGVVAYAGGRELGTVDRYQTLSDARLQLDRDITSAGGTSGFDYGLSYALNDDPFYEGDNLGYSELYGYFNSHNPCKLVEGYTLFVDGAEVGTAGDENSLRAAVEAARTALLANLKAADAQGNLDDITVISEIHVTRHTCTAAQFKDSQALEKALLGADGSTPVFRYEQVRSEKYTEVLEKTTEYKDDPTNYTDYKCVTDEGADGVNELVYRIICDQSGKELSRGLYQTNVITAERPKIITRGSIEPPPAVGTGTYIWPVKTSIIITSRFGEQREEFDGDSFHYGIDISEPIGTKIYASDGGTVIYCATSPSYGLMMKIEGWHGYMCVYAHLSESEVEVGDKIYQGQFIAKTGNTGSTTGPHLHFEIRAGGNYVDPLDYLPRLSYFYYG